MPLFAINKRKRLTEIKEDFLDYVTSNEIFKETPDSDRPFEDSLGAPVKSKFEALKVDIPEQPEREISNRQA